jgi:hypothetical protein
MLPTVVAVDWPSFEPESFFFSSSGLFATAEEAAPSSLSFSERDDEELSFFVPLASSV